MSISLNDDDLQAVMSAAEPLPPGHRDAFLQAVADALAKDHELGPGWSAASPAGCSVGTSSTRQISAVTGLSGSMAAQAASQAIITYGNI